MQGKSRRLSLLLIVTMSVLALSPAANAESVAEGEFLAKINATRAADGLGSLQVDDGLRSYARSHTEAMVDAGGIYHSREADLRATGGTGWDRIGENIGRGQTPTSLHEAFMASPGHKKNIVGDFNYVGIGTESSGGYLYVTVVFMKKEVASATTDPTPTETTVTEVSDTGGTFTDDDGNVHEAGIEAIAAEGITVGCNPPANSLYCPDDSLTRGEMAAFIARALDLPAAGVDHFNDDNSSVFEGAINRMAEAGITEGCNPPDNTSFCPTRTVTRGEMAAFMARAFTLPVSTANWFSDDNGHTFEGAINRLAEAGITVGCNPPSSSDFCPDDTIKRDQMATFLTRAGGLSH